MNGVFWIIIGILAFFLLFILVVVLVAYHNSKSNVDKPFEREMNKPFVLNFTNQGDNFIYKELSSKVKESRNRNNEVLCKSFQVDVDKDGNPKLPEKAKKPSTITTNEGRRITFARGSLDEDSEIIMYLPTDLNNVSDEFKNTKLFQFIQPFMMKIDYLEKTCRNFYEASMKNKEEIRFLMASSNDEEVVKKLKRMKLNYEDAEDQMPNEVKEKGRER